MRTQRIKNKLSVVISFLNEKEEVGNTVRSVRETAGTEVDVVVVNDASDDGYDYKIDLENYDVKYVVNESRKGAAMGKERAVQLCATPYFIILDAHMRFYKKGWHKLLIKELEKNQNQLLCCQTRVLIKENGVIKDKGKMGVYGAILGFDGPNLIPSIKWNDGKIFCELNNGQIPAVLGASYCTSKTYWQKIKGLKGLIHYGCEEAYISIKAWLEGGGCRLLENVIIGHIYRKNPPYDIETVKNRYNYYFIAETLFPILMRAKAHAIGIESNYRLYEEIQKLLQIKAHKIRQLRKYYTNNLKGHDFSYVWKINNVLTESEILILNKEETRLSEVISYIADASYSQNDITLKDGLCASLIALVTYTKIHFDNGILMSCQKLLNRILCAQFTCLPITLDNGICGIGVTLLWLLQNRIVSYGEIQEELQIIDKRVIERSLLRVEDTSMEYGIAGILAYLVYRIGHIEIPAPSFDKQYLSEAKRAAIGILNQRKGTVRELTYAKAFTYIVKEKLSVKIRIEDLYDLPVFLPKDNTYKKNGIDGTAGFAVYLINKLKTRQQYRKIGH